MADKRDEMRKKLQIDRFEDDTQKSMFNKFRKAGGEVIDLDREEKKHQSKKSNKKVSTVEENASIRQMRLEYEKRKSEEKHPNKQPTQKSISDSMKENPVNVLLECFSAKLGCVFSGIMVFSAKRFKRKFVNLILEKYQNSLLESRMVMASALHQNEMIVEEIKKKLAAGADKDFLYELIYRYDNIYNEDLFQKLDSMRNESENIASHKSQYIELFKPLYFLKNYSLSLKGAAERTLIFEKELRRLDATNTFSNYRKIANNIDFIFQKIYPKLFSLIEFYYKYDNRKKPVSFREYLKISEEDSIGYLTHKWKEDQKYFAQKERLRDELGNSEPTLGEAPPASEQQPEITDTVLKRSLALLKEYVDFEEILLRYRKEKTVRALFYLNDKVFLTYALIDFFDKEYSSLFTSTKVKYNVNFSYGNKIDIKKDLSDSYYKINNLVYERVNEYLKVIREIRKVDNDGYITIDQKSSRLNQYSVQRSQISRQMRKGAAELFDKFSQTLIVVLNDFETNKMILQNPEEVLEFNKKIDGVRLLNGKKVVDGIQEAYYISYLIHFLLVDGDLGGYSVSLEKPFYLSINVEK